MFGLNYPKKSKIGAIIYELMQFDGLNKKYSLNHRTDSARIDKPNSPRAKVILCHDIPYYFGIHLLNKYNFFQSTNKKHNALYICKPLD
ncbi:MAG TPA: hypothetical protein DDY13_13320 [Cytophagales bacterium]|nr:hypothetical protein [Cytophagales bacterium]